MKFDLYFLCARIFPAVITAIPLILFNHFYINSELSGFLHSTLTYNWGTEISSPLIFIIFLTFINRIISKKIIENRHFKGQAKMPTTNLLLWKNDYFSKEYKKIIYKKIHNFLGINLLTQNEEKNDETEARKRIVEAVSLIIEKLKGGRLLLQHNIEYGFFRNLVGGSFIAAIFSIFCAIFFFFYYPSPLAFQLSIFGMVIYIGILILHKNILDWLGEQYAKRLIQEFMSLE